MKPSVRTTRFVVVGWLGFGVQLATLLALVAAKWPWLLATCVAVEAAIVHNFLWHERWTWKDRVAAAAVEPRLARFARYNAATGLVSILGNAVLTGFYLSLLHAPTVVANALAVLTMTVANFFLADRWIFPRLPAPALLAVAVFMTPGTASAQPEAETLQAWDRYIAMTEARIDRERDIVRGAADVSGETKAIASGTIHHWRGAVFVPRMTVDRLLGELLDPPPDAVQPEDVAEWRTLGKSGDTIRTYLRLVRRSLVTVEYDTEHEMTFRRWSPTFATGRSIATSIREVGGDDHGFLWRLNSYWRYRQTADGVVVELESVTLSRSIPAIIRPIAMPIVQHVARESMARTLAAFSRRFES